MTFKKVTPGDPLFRMNDGLMMCNRAGFEFSTMCPTNLVIQVQDAIAKGLIKPVAYLREEEYVWESLKE